MRALWVLLLLLPTAMAAIDNPDGDHEAVLYLHLDGLQAIQMHPLPPPANFSHEQRPGGVVPSLCVPTPAQGFSSQQLHTWYGIVSPTIVEYREGGGPHPMTERGIRDDLRLSDRPMVLDWYMRAATAGTHSTAAPQVVVQATMREGDDVSVDDEALNSGRIIAEARSDAAVLSPALAGHPQTTYEPETGLYHVRLELPPRGALSVPQRESFNLRVDVFVDNPACRSRDQYAMPDLVTIVSDPGHRPTLTLGVRNPVRIERIAAVVGDDEVLIAAKVRAAFGAGDAILAHGALVIDGPTAASDLNATWGRATVVDGRAFPERADDGYQARLQWGYEADAASGGVYHATLTVATESGAVATAMVPFGLGASQQSCTVLLTGEPSCSIAATGTDKRTPAPLTALLPALLVGAALLRRP